MNIKRKSIFSILTAIALVTLLCLSLVLPSLAYSESKTPGVNAPSAVTKLFKMPINTVTPDATFIFEFEAIGIDGGSDPTGMPKIDDAEVTFTYGDPETVIEGDTKIVAKETGDLLTGVLPTDWPSEGVYTYIVKEKPEGIVITDSDKEEERYSNAQYEIEFWVVEYPLNSGNYYAQYVNVKIVKGFIDEYYEGSEGGEKVDPTPGGKNQYPDVTTIEDDFSHVYFTNYYWKTYGGGETDPTITAAEIIKNIKGNGAEFDRRFNFRVTVKQPSIIKDLQQYKAYILDENDNIITSMDHYNNLEQDSNLNYYILFTSDVEITNIKLTDKERLVFVDLPVGTCVEVFEDGVTGYVPKYQRTSGGDGEFTGYEGQEWGFPRNPGDKGPHYIKDGANFNIVIFTNTRSGATPMGISVDNLPYVVLIGIGLVALTALVVVRARRKAKHDA